MAGQRSITVRNKLSESSSPGNPVYDYVVFKVKNLVMFRGEQIFVGKTVDPETVEVMIDNDIDVVVEEWK